MEIVNQDLSVAIIPTPDDGWQQICDFALTFDGYAACGNFEKCADIANARRNETLTDLRTCLFFEQRRWRHFAEIPDEKSMEYIRRLIQAIRAKVLARELT